jgi:hypothetical protein
MLQTMTGLPPGVLGFEINGALHADDYRQVLLPAVEAAIQQGEKIRIVLVFERFDGLSGGALGQDLKLGVEHLTPLAAHRAGHRHRLDDPPHGAVRLDDPGRAETLPAPRA